MRIYLLTFERRYISDRLIPLMSATIFNKMLYGDLLLPMHNYIIIIMQFASDLSNKSVTISNLMNKYHLNEFNF